MITDLPVYILIRTSGRPKFFANLMESIKGQTYNNIVTIVHTDDPGDTYVTGDIIIHGQRYDSAIGTAPYNLYNNALLQAIPDGEGWYHFIDDDDMYNAPDAIEKLVFFAKRDCVNVARVRRWNDTIFPANWRQQLSYQTECFFLHTNHKDKATWWANKGGDHNYSRQLTKILPINWIDNLIICKAQEGKGHGRRYDLGERPPDVPIKQVEETDVLTVEFLKTVRSPAFLRGTIGEIKQIRRDRAERLERKGKARILKVVNDGEVNN